MNRLDDARPAECRVQQRDGQDHRDRVGARRRRDRPPQPLPQRGRPRREADQRAQPAHHGHRGEDLVPDVELGGQDEPEHRHVDQRVNRPFEQPEDQVGAYRHEEDQGQARMSLTYLVDQRGRETEEEPADERREERPGDPAAQQVRGPRGQRRRRKLGHVEREQRPVAVRQRLQRECRGRDRGGPGEVDAARRPGDVREERPDVMPDGVWPPAERPDEQRAVLRLRGQEPGGHPVQDPRAEQAEGHAGVEQQREQVPQLAAGRAGSFRVPVAALALARAGGLAWRLGGLPGGWLGRGTGSRLRSRLSDRLGGDPGGRPGWGRAVRPGGGRGIRPSGGTAARRRLGLPVRVRPGAEARVRIAGVPDVGPAIGALGGIPQPVPDRDSWFGHAPFPLPPRAGNCAESGGLLAGPQHPRCVFNPIQSISALCSGPHIRSCRCDDMERNQPDAGGPGGGGQFRAWP